MTLLLCSLAALAIAPALYGWLHRWRRLHNLFDTLLIIIVALMVLAEVMVESYGHIGWQGPLIGIAGMAVPSLIEQGFSRLALPTHRLTTVLGLVALTLHSLMDGATLSSNHDNLAAVAVVLHQLPLGIAVWWLVRHALGRNAAIIVLTGMGVATVIGYLLTQSLLPLLTQSTTTAVQAFLAGSLLHILVHRRKPRHDHN